MNQIVKLNVGGVPYVTSMSTLTQYHDSMLGAFVEQENEQNLIKEGKDLFIDRNGPIFKYVLEYLRNGANVILPDDVNTLRELRLEAEFYLLGGLKASISKKLEEPKEIPKPKWKVGDMITTRDITCRSCPQPIKRFLARGDLVGSWIGTIMEIDSDRVVAKLMGFFQGDSEKYLELSVLCVLERSELRGEPPVPSN